MSNAVLSQFGRSQSPAVPGTRWLAVPAVWLLLVFLLGAGEVLVTPSGTPPLPLLIAVVAPVIAFLAAAWASVRFREFVLAADLRMMAGIQAWRFAGLGFLALYTYGVLPGIFAWPAGLGDIAVAIAAPWIIVALIQRPGFAASKAFVMWNVLGILDLVVAVGMGTVATLFAHDVTGAVTTAPMAHLPLVLIPAFLVPGFIMLHLAALFQARNLAGRLKGGGLEALCKAPHDDGFR
jgi:hypothetical protein